MPKKLVSAFIAMFMAISFIPAGGVSSAWAGPIGDPNAPVASEDVMPGSIDLGEPTSAGVAGSYKFGNLSIAGESSANTAGNNIGVAVVSVDSGTIEYDAGASSTSISQTSMALDKRTLTLVFSPALNAQEASEILRDVVTFKPNADTAQTVSIKVSDQETKLPTTGSTTTQTNTVSDVILSEFTPDDASAPHYYAFVGVNGAARWTDAYNSAQDYSFMGMRGYLVTVTSANEDQMLTSVSTVGAWSAATRVLKGTDENATDKVMGDENVYLAAMAYTPGTSDVRQLDTAPANGVALYQPKGSAVVDDIKKSYYWADGPADEVGKTIPDLSNWGNGEPNNGGGGRPGAEAFMQVNYYNANDNALYVWNDMPNQAYLADYNVKGFIVEFGGIYRDGVTADNMYYAEGTRTVNPTPTVSVADTLGITPNSAEAGTLLTDFTSTTLLTVDNGWTLASALNDDDTSDENVVVRTVANNTTRAKDGDYLPAKAYTYNGTTTLGIDADYMTSDITWYLNPTLDWYDTNDAAGGQETELNNLLALPGNNTAAVVAQKDTLATVQESWGKLSQEQQDYVAKKEAAKSNTTVTTAQDITDHLALLTEITQKAEGLDAAADEAKKKIDQLPNLTDDEKTALKNEVDAAVTDAKNNFADDLADEKAFAKIDLIVDTATTLDTVSGQDNLGDQQESIKTDINNALTDGLNNIDAADTTDEIDLEKNRGIARNDVEEAAADSTGKLNDAAVGNPQNDGIKAAIDQAKQDALDAIDTATNTNEVASAVEKDLAKKEIVDNVTADVDDLIANPNYTGMKDPVVSDTGKQDLIDSITNTLDVGFKAVDVATDSQGITSAKEGALAATDLEKAKADAIVKGAANAADAIQKINAKTTLSDADKADYVSKVNGMLEKAVDDIKKATTQIDIVIATANLYDGAVLEVRKASEYDTMLKDAADTQANINALNNMPATGTEEIKQGLTKALSEALESAKAALDAATDIAQATSDIDAAVKAFNNTKALIDEQTAAIAEIQAAQAQALANLETRTDLTPEQKAILTDGINQQAVQAAKDIQAATDTTGITAAKDAGINNITAFADKATAIEQLNKVANENNAAIDTLPNLTDQQRQEALAAVDQALKEAVTQIANAPADQNLNELTLTGQQNLDKQSAIAQVNDDRQKATEAINSLTGLTNSEKQQFIDAVNAQADASIQIITNLNPTFDPALSLDEQREAFKAAITTEASTHAALASATTDEAIVADFVKQFVSDPATGSIYSQVNINNYPQILSGNDAWNTLTQAQKDAVNALITAANANISGAPQTYEEFLLQVDNFITNQKADQFIKDYLTGNDGAVYKEANEQNYQQIISGKDAWDKMTKEEQDVINEKLVAATGKTYPELLAEAQRIADSLNKKVVKKAALAATGDTVGSGAVSLGLLALAASGAALGAYRKTRTQNKHVA